MIRKRVYHFEPVLGIDSYDQRTLRALKIKLSRDYLGFFKSLSNLYRKSVQKKEIEATILKINRMISLLESVVLTGVIDKKDIDKLVTQVNEINEDRDYYLHKVTEVKAFSEKISRVTAKTGISPEDLNITEEIVKGVTRQAVRAQKGRVDSFFRGTMPGVSGLVAEVGRGALAAVAGPFAPIISPIVGDIFRLGRGAIRRTYQRRKRRLAGQLRPVARVSPVAAEEMFRARGRAPILEGLGRRISIKRAADPLTYFFNRKAYRTKWTKELLQRIKRLGGRGPSSLFGNLTKKIKQFLPAIGAATLALGKTGLAGAITVFTTVELYKLIKLTKEYYGTLKNVKEFKEKQQEVLARQQEKAAGRVIFAKTEKERQAAKRARTVYQKAEEERLRREVKEFTIENITTWGRYGLAGMKTELGLAGRTNFKPSGTIVTPLQPEIIPRITERRGYTRTDLESIIRTTEEANQKLVKSIEKLSRSIDKEKAPFPFKAGNVGNPYDSADILLDKHISVGLELGGVD